MIAPGLLVLLAVGGLAVSGITTRDHGAHSPARSGLLSYHLYGARRTYRVVVLLVIGPGDGPCSYRWFPSFLSAA